MAGEGISGGCCPGSLGFLMGACHRAMFAMFLLPPRLSCQIPSGAVGTGETMHAVVRSVYYSPPEEAAFGSQSLHWAAHSHL